MKFTINSKELGQALAVVSKAINKHETLPILQNALLRKSPAGQGYTLTGRSSDSVLTVPISLNEIEGSLPEVCLFASQLRDVVTQLGDQMLIATLSGDHIMFEHANGAFDMPVYAADEYPATPQIESPLVSFDIDANILLENLRNAASCVKSGDTLRPVMASVCLDVAPDGVTVVGSDGTRLYRYAYTPGAPFLTSGNPCVLLIHGMYVPAIIAAMHDCDTVHVSADTSFVTFSSPHATIRCKIVGGTYPNYNSVFPSDSPYNGVVNVRDLKSAIRRVSLMGSPNGAVKLTFDNGTLTVEANNMEFATSSEESLDFVISDMPSPVVIGFSKDFLLSLLDLATSAEVKINFATSTRSVVIREDDSKSPLSMLLMPVLLQD